jgi:hypothetical protein
MHTFAMERWINKSSHEITIIKESINEVFIKKINHAYNNLNEKN